jgi:SAM-dependent methyltransferase
VVFRLSQIAVAPGAGWCVGRHLRRLRRSLGISGRLLEVGCGPESRLFRAGLHPIGVDMSLSYMRAYAGHGSGVVASAERLPFADALFDSVWTIFMFHHVPDALARQALEEMVRVCRPGGHVVVIDGVWPRVAWRRPLAYLVRRLDRGRFMRDEAHLRQLLSPQVGFATERLTYTLNGLELLICHGRVDAQARVACAPATDRSSATVTARAGPR